MLLIDIAAIVVFFILLAGAVFMLIGFYVCDSRKCKAFEQSKETALPGTKPYLIALLSEMYNDGIWPFPYIGAAIATPLCIWFLGVPLTVRTFAIMFFVTFVVIYFMFTFFGHHYIRPISAYVSEYIQDVCPGDSREIRFVKDVTEVTEERKPFELLNPLSET